MQHTSREGERKQIFDKALKTYIDQVSENPEVIGIIASGSYAHGRLDKHSDIDVYVILKEGIDFRERGNTWIGGVEIEYFHNPPEQIRAYFRQEGDKPHTAHIMAHGECRLERDPVIAELVNEARARLKKKAEPITDVQRELAKYGLDDQRKDYWDCLDNGDMLGARLVAAGIIEDCIKLHFQLKQQFPQKKKRLIPFLSKDDPEFGRILAEAIEASCRRDEEKSLLALISHIEDRLGGPRPREWIFRGNLNLA
ncbi:MAG: nucleotidyltransferase domain-containing protein [Bacteroidia bacterium]|nr:nucleotidyltransferase domain-containing protein [Bacteroidia bacterium]